MLRRHAGSARVMAVVKADAYGHGLLRCLPGLSAADGLALLEIEQARRVREAGWRGPVLLLEGVFDAEELALCAAEGFAVVVHEAWQLRMLLEARLPRPVHAWLKLNSGMNRLGFRPEAFAHARAALEGHASVASLTLMTHFASAETAGGVDAPLARFEQACSGSAAARSCANSAALLLHPRTRFDWVRPGIALYGASPFGDLAGPGPGLRAAMTLTSEVIAVQELQAGDAVGYGGSFVAERPMRAGVVACGYADGYPRHAPTGTPVLVQGRATVTLGRVSMDMLMVDLSVLPDAGVGAEVELWGERLPVDAVARAAGTLGYELLCALSSRVPVSVAPAPG